ncbi:MAG TPA: chemotaxis protein CheB [Myxococcaceae bacterium]|nr:chemotaxis protein CheB [Myxococcaceae bacterium]
MKSEVPDAPASGTFHRDIVVIGTSAGGLAALQHLVSRLPADLPAALFIVMHSAAEPGSKLAEILSGWGPLPAHAAIHGERIAPGRIYVAPSDTHMTLRRDFVRVTRGPRENGHRPAVDPLFRTAARMYGPRVIGVVLTGNQSCGTEGLMAVKAQGGVAVVQSDPEYPGMVTSAVKHVAVDHTASLAALPGLLRGLVVEPISDDAVEDTQGSHTVLPPRSNIVCPTCQEAMVESDDGGVLRYRCQVGHAFSIDSLLVEKSEALESALWASVRSLEESAQLADRLASSASRNLSQRFRDKADALRQHAGLIQDVLLHGATLDAEAVTPFEGRTSLES